MIRYYFHLKTLCLLLIFLGCKESVKDHHKNQKAGKEAIEKRNCEFTFDKKGNRNGKYICYFPNGKVWISGTLKNDSIKIYEHKIFFLSGRLKEYSFYNPLGELTFRRAYSINGEMQKEEGDFLSHEELSQSHISIGDSIVLKIFVAAPPGISFKMYGVDSKGRYDMAFIKDEKIYVKKKIIYGTRAGDFTFPYEVEVFDSVSNKKTVLNSNVSFKVKEAH